MRYPKEAVVFEVVSRRASDSEIRIGTHVEAGGPCCMGTEREWRCQVLTMNGYNAEDGWLWASNLRPLTPAAREMLKISKARGQ